MPVRDAVVIGDNLRTDIGAAIRLGARSVLMLTGVTSRADLEAAPDSARPTAVAEDAAGPRANARGACPRFLIDGECGAEIGVGRRERLEFRYELSSGVLVVVHERDIERVQVHPP